MGIADSRGVIYDFAGPYTIGVDDMAFGSPTRYLQLDPGHCSDEHWDEAVARASEIYRWVVSRASRVFGARKTDGRRSKRTYWEDKTGWRAGRKTRQAGRHESQTNRQTHNTSRAVDRWM